MASEQHQDDLELGKLDSPAKSNNNNNDAVVNAKNSTQPQKLDLESNTFTGLTIEQLRAFENDPFWRKVRIVLFTIFWLIWAVLLAVAIIIVIITPKCPPRPALDVYQKAVAYKVLPLSFADSDGNNLGDLKGLIQKLGYIESLGANTVVVGPINRAASDSQALYDTVSYKDVHERLGDWNGVKDLVRESNKRGMQVFVELNLNMVSDQYKAESKDFVSLSYEPTSNCSLRMRDGYKSAWVSNSSNWFYSSFARGFVEWNYESEKVRQLAASAVDEMLNADVDGIVLKDVSFYHENLTKCGAETDEATQSFWSVDHAATMNQAMNFEIVQLVSDKVRKLNAINSRKKRVLIVEVDLPQFGASAAAATAAKYVERGADAVVVDSLAHFVRDDLKKSTIQQRLTAMFATDKPVNKWWPLWQLSTPEYGRIVTRFGEQDLREFLSLGVFLPGTLVNYYGDELGITDTGVTSIQSAANRDSAFFLPAYRSTMPWSTTTDVKSDANVELQMASGYPQSKSIVKFFQELVKTKKAHESLIWGEFRALNTSALAPGNADLVAFGRVAQGFKPAIVLVNFADAPVALKLFDQVKSALGAEYKSAAVVFSSDDALKNTDFLLTNVLYLAGHQIAVLTLS